MTIENREDYIKYRYRRARESFEEALILADNENWKTTNRTGRYLNLEIEKHI